MEASQPFGGQCPRLPLKNETGTNPYYWTLTDPRGAIILNKWRLNKCYNSIITIHVFWYVLSLSLFLTVSARAYQKHVLHGQESVSIFLLVSHCKYCCMLYHFQVIYLRQRRRHVFVHVCLFVSLSLCQQDYSKTHAWICMKYCVSTNVITWTNWLTFEPHLAGLARDLID